MPPERVAEPMVVEAEALVEALVEVLVDVLVEVLVEALVEVQRQRYNPHLGASSACR